MVFASLKTTLNYLSKVRYLFNIGLVLLLTLPDPGLCANPSNLDTTTSPEAAAPVPAPAAVTNLDENAASIQTLKDTLQAKFSTFPDQLQVKWNNLNKSVARVEALQIPVSKINFNISKTSKANAARLVLDFVKANSEALGIKDEELKERTTFAHTQSSSGALNEVITRLSQQYRGLEVIDSEIVAIFKDDTLTRLDNNSLANIDIDINPDLSAEKAFQVAKHFEVTQSYQKLAAFPRQEETRLMPSAPIASEVLLAKSRLVVFPLKLFARTVPTLAWEVELRGVPSAPLFATYYIGAKSGMLLERRESRAAADVWGKVYGCHFPTNPIDSGNICSIENIDGVTVEAQNLHTAEIYSSVTGTNGDYELEGLSSSDPHSFRYKASGLQDIFDWHEVIMGIYNPPFEKPYSGGSVILNQANDQIFTSYAQNYYSPVNQVTNVLEHFARLRAYWGRAFTPFNFFYLNNDLRFSVVVDAFYPHLADHTWFSRNSGGVLPSDQEDDYDGFFSFESRSVNLNTGALLGDAAALDADVLNHEFAHLIQYLIRPSFISNLTDEQGAIAEGLADYWAASISGSPHLYESFFIGQSSLQRDVWNYFKYDNTNDFDLYYLDKHKNGLVLAGALWHMRLALQNKYGTQAGKDLADELTIRAMKSASNYWDFPDILYQLLYVDNGDWPPSYSTPNKEEICAAFCSFHHICADPLFPNSWDCNHMQAPNNPTPTPTQGVGRQNKVSVPINQTHIDTSFSAVRGSASAANLTNFDLQIRRYGGVGNWTNYGITVAGGNQNVLNNILGYLNPGTLTHGCYYDLKLTSSTADGSSLQTLATFKHYNQPHDEMPRMVCVYRTANEGGENDGCEMVAIASDPQWAYYSLPSNDWRRGRSHLLSARPNSQYNASSTGSEDFGPTLCDPDNANGDCLRDCWNIIGTNSNNSGGNDGRDNVFCAPNSGCSPVSFSGCPADNSACINSALAGLESVYGKVLYFRYANWDLPQFWWPWGAVRHFKNCSDDYGDQYYSLMAFNGAYQQDGNMYLYPPMIARSSIVTQGREGSPIAGDIFDGFDQLYSSSNGPAVLSTGLVSSITKARTGMSPAVDCTHCGCPGGSNPYCNSSTGQCEAKCSDGTPFGSCSMQGNQVRFCDQGTMVNGCHRPECTGLICGDSYLCNYSNGACQQCLNNDMCNDSNSCTLNDRCQNGYCTNNYMLNDCSALPAGACGTSPSGCHSCGCDCAHICKPKEKGPGSICVYNKDCNPKKCNKCGLIITTDVNTDLIN